PSVPSATISPITPAGFGLVPPLVATKPITFFPAATVSVTSSCTGTFQLSDLPTDLPLMKSSKELSAVKVARVRAGRAASIQARRTYIVCGGAASRAAGFDQSQRAFFSSGPASIGFGGPAANAGAIAPSCPP